jgi:hypothetical protein
MNTERAIHSTATHAMTNNPVSAMDRTMGSDSIALSELTREGRPETGAGVEVDSVGMGESCPFASC